MKTTNLEYSDVSVLFPDISFFLEKIENLKPFHFLRINHGILDLIHLSYDNLSDFENDFLSEDLDLIAQKMIQSSKNDVNTPFEIWHKNSDIQNIKEKTIILLKVLKKYKTISPKIDISLSLGVGLHTHWGTWVQNHPYQKGRTEIASFLNNITTDDFYYSGVLKHYTIKREIFQLFDSLNKKNFLVIFLGRNYLKLYESIFKIDNFKHIEIPKSGAINFIDEYIDTIKMFSQEHQNTIVFHSTGHLLSFYIAHQLADTNIFGVDIGRSFDLLVKGSIDTHPDIPKCWATLNEEGLIKYVDSIRNT